ncbi:uncharacterized protein PG998_000164 [Apiospora kogelbergensis]|uniref:uncharacterized protein n=1 Tax=Apiospora kogelbergensis TaxID=1337665 RepID=UPI00312E1A01
MFQDSATADTQGSTDLSAVAWMPQYFNEQERAWLAETHIAWQLRATAGSFPMEGPITIEDIPGIPDMLTYPQDVKLFLCWCYIAKYCPGESKFAVFMPPVGFMNEDDRKGHYLATGTLSERMGTIGEFFDYALEMINKQGRDMVIGMMNYWTDPAKEYEKLYEQSGQTVTRAKY